MKTILVFSLAAADLILSVALVYSALGRPIYYVGAQTSGTALPGKVPEPCIRDFVLSYVQTFETFTPSTIDSSVQYLSTLVSPRQYHAVAEILSRRKTLVKDGQVSSMVVLDPDSFSVRAENDRYLIQLAGIKKVYLSEKLSSQLKVEYSITVETAAPTHENPLGLYIAGQRTKETLVEERRE